MTDHRTDGHLTGRTRWAWLSVGVGAGMVLIFFIYSVFYTGGKADEAASSADASTQLLSFVKDCVEPGGDCYKRSRKQRQNTLNNINRVTAYAVACSSELDLRMSVPERARVVTDCIDRMVQLDRGTERRRR